jgi:hypothetical protein
MKAKTRKTTKARSRTAAAAPSTGAEVLARAFRESYTPPPVPASTTVVLDPDIAPHFRDSRAVNEALRALLRIVKQVRGITAP